MTTHVICHVCEPFELVLEVEHAYQEKGCAECRQHVAAAAWALACYIGLWCLWVLGVFAPSHEIRKIHGMQVERHTCVEKAVSQIHAGKSL